MSAFVTQDQFSARLSALGNSLRQLIFQNISAPGSLPASGGYINSIALTNRIDNLSNVTISNATVHGVSGLAESDIPSLSDTYLPLAGGTVAGNLTVSGSFNGGSLSLSLASTSGIVATNSTTTNATSTTLFATLGHFTTGIIDTLTRIDRLARSTFDLFAIIQRIVDAGAHFRSIAEPWADTSTSAGRLMIAVLGGLADVERDLIRTRTTEGRERAKARGVKLGPKFKLTPDERKEALARRAAGETTTALGRSYNVSHTTISRLRP